MESYSINKPNYVSSFKQDLASNFNVRFISQGKYFYMNDVIRECEMYACDICLHFKKESGGILPKDWIEHLADQTWRAINEFWPQVKYSYPLDTCIENVKCLLDTNAEHQVNIYYNRI